MIEYLTSNKEAFIALGTAVVVLAGTIIRLTSSKKDDSVFNTIVNAIGLGALAIKSDEEPKA